MRRLLAIVGQTATAAVRFRVVLAVGILLVVGVAALPFLIRHNGTARMFSQVMITYTLTLTIALLGFLTLWLSCGALAGELETGQLQMVVIKPIARWQIWFGKWLGVLFVDVVLLALTVVVAGFLLHWRARELSPEQQTALREEVLVARGTLHEAPTDLSRDIEALVRERLQAESAANLDPALVREQMALVARARVESVAPNNGRLWRLQLGRHAAALRDRPLHLRILFHAAQPSESGLFESTWVIGDVASGRFERMRKQLSAATAHEFAIPPNLYNAQGTLDIICENRSASTLLFRLEDGLELLYPFGGFVPNLLRGSGIILGWLGLLAAVGLAASSLLSFPTAAVVSLALLYVGSNGGSFAEAVQEGSVFGMDHETQQPVARTLDWVFLPLFRSLHFLVDAMTRFSPVADLSSGRAIAWESLLAAFLHTTVLGAGFFAWIGITALRRRQLGLPLTAT